MSSPPSATSKSSNSCASSPPLPQKYLRAVHLIETLERYNGLPFINFNIETGAVTTATGRVIPPEQAGGGSVQTALRESRRWRDGAISHPPHYRFRHIDMACLRPYPDGIHFKTRGHAGKQTSQTREIHSGAIKPASALGMEMKAMRQGTNQQYTNTGQAIGESRRWRDGDWGGRVAANEEWRRMA